ncbi:MAG: hypothetical protein GY796_35385 [Chloroflexi bacterium]|nr:hypothetical protein [Chloroflexota bacterium]
MLTISWHFAPITIKCGGTTLLSLKIFEVKQIHPLHMGESEQQHPYMDRFFNARKFNNYQIATYGGDNLFLPIFAGPI